jgi:hypothetical protein
MVFSKTAVDLIGLANLDMMHRVSRGYDTCGLVGQTTVASGPHERGGAPLTVQTATTVNLTKTGNTEADREEAKHMVTTINYVIQETLMRDRAKNSGDLKSFCQHRKV